MNRDGSSPANFLLPLLTMKKLTSNVCGVQFEHGKAGEEWKLGLEFHPSRHIWKERPREFTILLSLSALTNLKNLTL